VLVSLWDRIGMREQVVKKAWKPVKFVDGHMKDDPNRVFSFSRAFKEMDRLESKYTDIIKTNAQLDQQLGNIKEKKSLIEMRAKACYEFIIKAGKSEYQNCGLIALMSQMHEMDFDIQDLPYPNHTIDQRGFEFIVRYSLTEQLHEHPGHHRQDQARDLAQPVPEQALHELLRRVQRNPQKARSRLFPS